MKNKNRMQRLALLGAFLAMSAGSALASGEPDASSIVTTATNAFNTVGTLIASVVGFFVVVKIVKWIRK